MLARRCESSRLAPHLPSSSPSCIGNNFISSGGSGCSARTSATSSSSPQGSSQQDSDSESEAYYAQLSDEQLKSINYARYVERRRRRIAERDAERLTEEELARRAKIGEANKGRVPWNKGRKHSPGELMS